MMNSCDPIIEAEIMKVLDEWQETFSRRDMEAWKGRTISRTIA